MTRWQEALVAGLTALVLTAPAAANQLAYPGDVPSDRVIRAQKKAEKAFEAGDYDRAMWFYRKELAPIGDKYSQYMIGHMYANGLGVPRNVIRAAAWFQVAAERGHEGIIKTSEAFQQQLSPEQVMAASQTAETLREELGDIALLKREIRRDMDRLRDVTGTRTASCDARPGTVFLPFALQRQFPVSRYCEILNARIDERVAYIQGYVTYGPLELLPDEEEAEGEEVEVGTEE